MKQVIGYVRVSTDEQATIGYSIAEQVDTIMRYCKDNKIDNVTIIEDDGISGKTLERPGIQTVLEEVRKDNIDKFIIKKVDRLGRNQADNEHVMLTYLTHGTDFISVTEDFNLEKAMGRFAFNLRGIVAQLESEQIGERSVDGLVQKAKQGEYPHGNIVPYGYRKNKSHYLIAINSEIEVIKKVFEYYVIYNLTAYEVVQRIKEEIGKEISQANVYRFITRELYRGRVNSGEGKRIILCEYLEHEDENQIKQFIESENKPSTELRAIVTEEMIEMLGNRSRVRKYGKHVYNYKNKVYINGKRAKHDKTVKKSGKEYWYYFVEEKGRKKYVNQNDIDIALRKRISDIEYNEFSEFDEEVTKVAKVYTRNEIPGSKFYEMIEEKRKHYERLTEDFKRVYVKKENEKVEISFE
ncbi:recombinase family protein [Mollicutes bacterium LVI A0075]|nr:recombinase family protein [Mollicutes bacterium LVI A0075]